MRTFRINEHRQMISELSGYIESIVEQKDRLLEELKNFKKDDEIQKLQNEINNLYKYSVHVMNQKEYDAMQEFKEKHYSSCKSNVEYIISGTGIGNCIEIQCKKCKENKNITDVEGW